MGSRRRAIKCAICRQTTSHTEISYVFTTQSSSHDQELPVKVGDQGHFKQLCPFLFLFFTTNLSFGLLQGSHSTKVEAVVRTLKKIQMNDPGAKCLVFSTVNEAFIF